MPRPPARLDRAQCSRIAETCTQLNLRKAARAVGQIFDDALRPTGLRGTQFSLLVALSVLERATVARVADALQLDPTTLTRNLAPLEREGLVRSGAGDDARERWVELTEAGARRLEAAIQPWERAQRKVVQELGATRWSDLLSGLKAAAELRAAARRPATGRRARR